MLANYWKLYSVIVRTIRCILSMHSLLIGFVPFELWCCLLPANCSSPFRARKMRWTIRLKSSSKSTSVMKWDFDEKKMLSSRNPFEQQINFHATFLRSNFSHKFANEKANARNRACLTWFIVMRLTPKIKLGLFESLVENDFKSSASIFRKTSEAINHF